MATPNYYKMMNWKPSIGTIYCIANAVDKINLYYQVIELTTTKDTDSDGEHLHITYRVYDYRNNTNANIYYVKLEPLYINATHKNRDLVLLFQHEHGHDAFATFTITDAKRPKVFKTNEDKKATTTKLNNLLINHIYLCKHNAFTSPYSVEDFHTLYKILREAQSPFSDFMCPHKSLYDKLSNGDYEEYDWNDYTKRKFDKICGHKYIYDKLRWDWDNPTKIDNENSDNESDNGIECNDDDDDNNDDNAKTTETDEINMV
jgi:hypothetical protein